MHRRTVKIRHAKVYRRRSVIIYMALNCYFPGAHVEIMDEDLRYSKARDKRRDARAHCVVVQRRQP